MKFDYIIVGAGASGCVLANRLSENPNNKVCLLEAGPADNDFFIKIPAGIIAMMRSNSRNWRYWTEPQKALNNRKVYIPRGKTLGGSSSVNAMCYTRGHKVDYDHWESLGNKGWGYKDVLPLFKRSENYEPEGDMEYHGKGGPVNISELPYQHKISDVFVEAGVQAGYPKNDDFNGATQEGVGLYKVFQKNGQRHGAAAGYLHPVMDRPNLTVMTNAPVNRVLFDGKRAVGVEISHNKRIKRIEGNEVILSGGAINSPQILKLSGVGPKAELEAHNIDLVHDLPGVGENLQDHPDILIVRKTKRPSSTLALSLRVVLARGPKGLFDYFIRGKGIFTTNVAEGGGFVKSRPEEEVPDLQYHLSCVRLENHGLDLSFSIGHGYSGHVCILRPKSRGNITLRDANPRSPAKIDPNLLGHPDDFEGMLRGVKTVRKIFEQKAFDDFAGDEIFPGKDVQTDDELRQFIREKGDNIYHPVGTCKMGHDDMAVVDDELKVHGIEGLRVVDASIMPTLIGGNTTACCLMIGEKASDMILGK